MGKCNKPVFAIANVVFCILVFLGYLQGEPYEEL